MTDVRFGNAIVTMPDAFGQYVMVNGKRVYFEFSKWCGPMVVDAEGEPLKRQPGERNPFWRAFEAWLDEWWKLQPFFWAPSTDNKPSHHWQEQPFGYASRCGRRVSHGEIIWRAKEKRQCAACLALVPEQTKPPP